MPLASPGAISRAIWLKVPEAEREAFLTTEMRTYRLVMQGNHLDPGAIVLRVSTGAAEPKCFLTSLEDQFGYGHTQDQAYPFYYG